MISYVAAFLAAVANATSSALNRKAARGEPQRVQFRLRLIMDLLRRRAWLGAVALMITSFVFSAVALGTGQLASVQLIIILELPMTLILGAWIMRIHLSPQEWVGLAAVFSSWQLYACAATGILSTWLLENAYQAGPLTAAQPGITLMDPLAATTWGVVVFGEQIRGGWALGLAAIALAGGAAGVFLLIRSPRLQALQNAGEAAKGQGGGPGGRRAAAPRHRTAD